MKKPVEKNESSVYHPDSQTYLSYYWMDNSREAERSFTRISEIEDLGDRALLMESSFIDIIHFIKGNSFVEVANVGGDIIDIMPITDKMAAELPQEMPNPETLELVAPAPVYDIQLPSKYIYDLYKSGDPNSFSEWGPDADTTRLTVRHLFTKLSLGLWSGD